MSRAAQRPWHLVAYTDATELGGAERCLGLIVGGQPEHVRLTVAGIDARVVSEVAAASDRAERALLAPAGGKRDVVRGARHRAALAALRPTVLHLHLRHPFSCQWALVAGLTIPGVRTALCEQLVIPASNPVQAGIRRVLDSRVEAHVAVGERSARDLERHLGLRSGSVRTIWNGVPDPGAPPPRVAGSSARVAFAGRLVEQKGLDVLLRALREVPELTLVVAGDGPLRHESEQLAVELGVAERVEFVGWCDDIPALLAGVDAFALPSRYEALPLAVIEAMLCGLPVVATDVGSVRELLADDSGRVVPPDDATALARELRALAADPRRRRELGERARARAVAHFTAARMVRQWWDLYEELLER